MMQITTAQWEQLVKRLDAIEQSIFDDRKSLDSMDIRIAKIEEVLEKILKMQYKGQEKVTEAVKNATSEVIEPLQEQMDEFVDKKVITLKQKQIKNLGLIGRVFKTIRSWNE